MVKNGLEDIRRTFAKELNIGFEGASTLAAILKRRETMDVTIQELFDLQGKTCLITGATGHLGTAMAAALAEAGASVIASSRKLAEAQRAVAALPVRQRGQRHYAVAIDQMGDDTSIQRAFDAPSKWLGRSISW